MSLEELLSEKELEFYSKLESKALNEIDLERLSQLKEIVNSYSYNIESIMNNNNRKIIFKKILFKFSRESEDFLTYLIATNYFNDVTSIKFNNLAEVFTFIILVIDSDLDIANKYLSFVEQTKSNTKALIMYKQYCQKYNCLFDSKLLQAELILLEKKLKETQKETKKRTITG